jgi:glutamate synthase domain-containing protein 2
MSDGETSGTAGVSKDLDPRAQPSPVSSYGDPSPNESSGTYTPAVIEDIQIKAELGRYRIRGFGSLRPRHWATFDDLSFIPATLTRIPLEGYRETCSSRTVLGTRFAKQPIELEIPLMVTGMSFGALSRNAKTALSRGARLAGTSTTTGDGGMLDVERTESRLMIYEVLPSRFGINVQHLRQADAIELTISQGAKPGTGGLLLGSKVSEEIARIRPDDLVIKIEELREATEYRVPIFVKMGASRVFDDVRLAAKAGADVIVVDGMEGGTGASPELLQEHTGIPTLAAVCEARAALEDIGLYGKVQLVIAGGLRHGSDCAKAIALGADACYLGTALLIALNCNRPIFVEDYEKIGAAPYRCHHCHTGRCPVGITTQDPALTARLEVNEAAERVANFFHALTSEIQMLARACGKSDVHHLEPEDLRALTLEASMITGLPLAGTNRVFGGGPGWKNADRPH